MPTLTKGQFEALFLFLLLSQPILHSKLTGRHADRLGGQGQREQNYKNINDKFKCASLFPYLFREFSPLLFPAVVQSLHVSGQALIGPSGRVQLAPEDGIHLGQGLALLLRLLHTNLEPAHLLQATLLHFPEEKEKERISAGKIFFE